MIFSHKDFNFGGDHNTTFYVYLYYFRAPFMLQVNLLKMLCFQFPFFHIHKVKGMLRTRWRFGVVGNSISQINEVALRLARLVLGWVTVSGFNSLCGKFISV